MEENKELETTTEEQASVTPAAMMARKRLISQWPYRWLCGHVADRGRYLYRFSDPQHHDHEG